jgi:hypothetical protein
LTKCGAAKSSYGPTPLHGAAADLGTGGGRRSRSTLLQGAPASLESRGDGGSVHCCSRAVRERAEAGVWGGEGGGYNGGTLELGRNERERRKTEWLGWILRGRVWGLRLRLRR